MIKKNLMNGGTSALSVNLSEKDMEIIDIMKEFRLPDMKDRYISLVAADEIAKMSATDVLYMLFTEQKAIRLEHSSILRIKKSNIWLPEASTSLLEEHGIQVNGAELEQFSKFNFMTYGGSLAILSKDQFSRSYLASAFGNLACYNNIRTFYIKYEHIINPELRNKYERLVVNLDLLREIPLLIIDDWMSMIANDEDTRLLKSILEYRMQVGKGTIFASCYNCDAWEKFLTGTSNVKRTMKSWFMKCNVLKVDDSEIEELESLDDM